MRRSSTQKRRYGGGERNNGDPVMPSNSSIKKITANLNKATKNKRARLLALANAQDSVNSFMNSVNGKNANTRARNSTMRKRNAVGRAAAAVARNRMNRNNAHVSNESNAMTDMRKAASKFKNANAEAYGRANIHSF